MLVLFVRAGGERLVVKLSHISYTILIIQTVIISFLSLLIYDQNRMIDNLQTSLIFYFTIESSTSPPSLYNPPPLQRFEQKTHTERFRRLI